MIRAFINSIRGWLASRATKGGFRDEPNISSPEVLRRLRAEALAKVQDAESRHDDRDLGRARMALQEATHAEPRAAR